MAIIVRAPSCPDGSMWIKVLLVLVMCTGISAQAAGQGRSSDEPSSSTADQKHLAELVAQGEGPYTKLSESAWSTPYRGKNMPSITVRVATAQGGIFFFVDLFERKSISLSRNLLLKIAELNSNFDYGKVALTDDALQVRLDVRAKLVDAHEFKMMESQIASVADEAYGIIKDFVQ